MHGIWFSGPCESLHGELANGIPVATLSALKRSRPMRRCLTHVVVAAAMSFSVPVLAQESKCPPGAWFCAEAEVTVPQPQVPIAPTAPRVVLPLQVAPEEVEVAPQP